MGKRENKNIIYQIFLRAFSSEGTISECTKYLSDIADIGVDTVYLCPIAVADDDADKEHWSDRQKMSGLDNPKNPYRIKDYFTIDPEYGNDADLQAFTTRAHSLGMKVMLDLVYLHCGPNAVFISENPDFVQRDSDGKIIMGRWHFPLLNFECKELREYLYKNMLYFVTKFHIDGYRCDVGDGCPADFWEEGIKRVRQINPDFMMLNEGINAEYLKAGFDIIYNFSWPLADVVKGKKSPHDLKADWDRVTTECEQEGKVIRVIDNHDVANDSYNERFERVVGHDAVEAALIINGFIDGTLFLYNGMEYCDTNRHSIWYNRNFSKDGELVIDRSGADAQSVKTRRDILRKIAEIRHNLPAIADGKMQWLDVTEQIIFFARKSSEQNIYVAVNVSDKRTVCDLHKLDIKNILMQKNAEISDCIELMPYGYVVFEA